MRCWSQMWASSRLRRYKESYLEWPFPTNFLISWKRIWVCNEHIRNLTYAFSSLLLWDKPPQGAAPQKNSTFFFYFSVCGLTGLIWADLVLVSPMVPLTVEVRWWLGLLKTGTWDGSSLPHAVSGPFLSMWPHQVVLTQWSLPLSSKTSSPVAKTPRCEHFKKKQKQPVLPLHFIVQ